MTGRLEGSDEAMRRAAAVFAGPAPAMADMFGRILRNWGFFPNRLKILADSAS